MPTRPVTGPLVLPAAGGELRIGAHGGIAGIAHDGREHLTGWSVRLADWVLVDRTDDEAECELGYAGRADRTLRLDVRHAVAPVWSERWVLSLDPAADAARDEVALEVDLQLGPEVVGRGAAAGSEAWFAVLPADGTGPVLGARLQTGAVDGLEVGPHGVRWSVGPVRLAPGRRYAVGWQLGWYPTAWDFQRQLATTLPAALTVGEVWDLPADPDRVLLCAEELSISAGEHATEVTSHRPGRFAVELRSARGTVAGTVAWAPTLAQVVADRAGAALATADRTRGGTPRLPDAATALVLQYALGAVLVDDRDLAAEALELHLGERLSGPSGVAALDPFDRIVLAREVVRGADPALLDGLADRGAPDPDAPGAGLAAAQLALAAVVAGRRPEPAAPAGPAVERALLHPGGGPGSALLAGIRRLGAALGAGLAGEDLRPTAVGPTAYRIALLGMVPEALGPALVREWGCSVPVLADRARAALLARDDLDSATLAWLCVADPQR